MNAAVVIIVALFASTIGPVTLAHLTGKQRMKEKIEDWRRQDEVARRADEVAHQLLEKQNETAAKTTEAAELLVENNKVVAKTARVTNEKLDVIHTLVNSNMTAALQAELDATQAQAVLMREVLQLREDQGKEPNEEALSVLEALDANIQKLAANLKDRLEQTKVADAQIFIAAKKQHSDEEDP